MSTSLDVREFVSFLQNKPWYEDLAPKIADFLGKKNYSQQAIDEFLMTITKLIEQKFVDVVTRNTGVIPDNKRFGQRLLDLAVCRSFLPRGDPLYYLLFWFMKMPRNTSHHQFIDCPFLALVTFVTTANFALNEVERISPSQEVAGSSQLNTYDSGKERLRLSVSSVQKESHDFTHAKVEACLILPTGQVKTIELKASGKGTWKLDYDAHQDPPGLSRVLLRCYGPGKARFRIPCDFTYTRYRYRS